jgi:acetylornithine/N-succinyldiaminopimelate aminotransferase
MSSLVGYPGHEILLPDIVRAENCYLYDGQGKRYVDLEAGVWCTALGHGNPRLLRTIAEQSARIAHTGFNYSSAVVEQAATTMLDLFGFEGGHCVFLCSGSEAVEYGVRVVQSITDRPLLMTMTDSYFGAYGSASRKQDDEWFCFDWTACSECSDSDGDCEHWSAIPFERIGGFLFEPGSSSGLVRFPPEKLIRRIVDTIKKDDGLVVVNEVTTGVGRTGNWFGFQHYGISPDIVALGKSIGNGYPVSVTAFAPEIMHRLPGGQLKYAQSHQNDPLGAVVAREVVQVVLELDLVDRGRETAAILLAGLQGIKARTDPIGEIRARGLMVALEMVDDQDATLTTRLHRELVDRGYVLGKRPGLNVLRLDPALTIDPKDIEGFLTTFESLVT